MHVDLWRTDAELVQAALGGDPLAYRELVERHEQRIFRFLARHVMRLDDAEDLAQETFLQAYRCLPAFRGDAKFSTWLVGIALNVARNHANRSGPPSVPLDEIMTEALGGGQDPEAAAQCTAKLRAVQRVVAELPMEQRECVALVIFEGLSYEDASRILEVPAGTLKSRLARARTRLAAALRDY